MQSMKALFRSFLVMLLLWLIAQAVQSWPGAAKSGIKTAAVPAVQAPTAQKPTAPDPFSLQAKVRSLPVE
jgi:hypothetical protein